MVGLLLYFYQPEHIIVAILYAIAMLLVGVLFFRKNCLPGNIGKSFLVALMAYGFLNLFIYPSFMQYQSGSMAAKYINENSSAATIASTFAVGSYSFSFYTNKPFVYGNAQQLKALANQQPLIVYTTKIGLDSLQANGFKVNSSKVFPFYHASELTPEFLNHYTRKLTLEEHFVAIVIAN